MSRRLSEQNIVIVEDDPYISQSLFDFFSDKNTVLAFTSAEEALAAESEFAHAKIFILDYKLPGKNGVELFQHLREKFFTAKFLLITGEMSYEMAEETRELGMDGLLLKPFDFTILEDNIVALISATV